MIEIKFLFGDWKEATKEEAEKFYRTFQEGTAAIKTEDKQEYFNKHHIRGGHVLSTGKVETVEEQEERVFNHYKNDFMKENYIRFNVIEYVCNFPGINPFVMAARLMKEGIKIVFDDSSISKKDNEKKERKTIKLSKFIEEDIYKNERKRECVVYK